MFYKSEETKNNVIKWIKNFFEENGKGCNAVVGISGGKDSSVVAALCVEALGKDRVIGVLMPDGIQNDIEYSHELVNHLGIKSITVDIHNSITNLKHQIKPQLDDHWSSQTSMNLPARIRMSTLYAVSQSVNGRVANTCNLSEDYIGYSTRYGDSVGDFSPLANLTVTEVKYLGKNLGLPDKLINKVPSDGLCGKSDEDNLGFSYEVLDQYIRTGHIDNEDIKNKIDNLHNKNKFKLLPMPSYNPCN